MLDNLAVRIAANANPLSALLDDRGGSTPVGYTIHSSYDEMIVMTNDKWREKAGGIPMNSYLLASSAKPDEIVKANIIDRRILLLRVVGRAELATDRDAIRAVMEHFQDNPATTDPAFRMEEPISFSMLQWSGVRCKVLGTFYVNSSAELNFGADAEDFFAARHMAVRKPGAAALDTIVNFVDPIRQAKAEKDALALGMKRSPTPFQIGNVRFTSSNQLALGGAQSDVPVKIFPGDFLARRTAVFGMTRTGKSNTTKTMVSAVALSAFESDSPIGQIILDINGEYSNANNQDGGSSIADVFQDNTIRYRVGQKDGFRDIRVNFYENLEVGHQFIAENLNSDGSSLNDDLRTFVACDFSEPDLSDRGVHGRWKRRVAIYRTILSAAGFRYSPNYMIPFEVNKGVLDFLFKHVIPAEEQTQHTNIDQRAAAVSEFFELRSAQSGYTATPTSAARFWTKVREVERATQDAGGIKKDKVEKWLNPEDSALLAILVGKSSKTGPINGGQ